MCVKVFKNGPSKICGRQPLKNLGDMVRLRKFFKGCLPQIFFGPFLNTLTHIFFEQALIVFETMYQEMKQI